MNTKQKEKIEQILSERDKEIRDLKNKLKKIEEDSKLKQKTILLDFLQVIDTFEQAESIIRERKWEEDEVASKAIKRLLTAKKKVLFVFEKYGIAPMSFENNLANDDDCKTVDTEYSDEHPNNYILSIEKKGYVMRAERTGIVVAENLRLAEVVIVKK
jgi:molecular chaperone GrpE (heat shock protein)